MTGSEPDGSRLLAPYLRPDEHVLWAGRPDPSVRFSSSDAFMVPFSILWCSFAIFWTVSAAAGGAPIFFWLWGTLFVLIGLYFVAGRFVVKARTKRRTAYVLTDHRAVIFPPNGMLETPIAYQPLMVRYSGDHHHVSATIGATTGGRLNPAAMYANSGMEIFTRFYPMPVAFYDVAEPELLLAAIETARRGTGTVREHG